MKQALIYSAKVWLTTLIVGPLLAVAVTYFIAWYSPIISYSGLGLWVGVYFDFAAGLLLLPLALLFWLTTFYLLKTQLNVVSIKSVLATVGIVFCILPFVLTGSNMQVSLTYLFSYSYWLPAYLVVAITCIWVHKL